MWIGHRKEIQKLTFRALALRRSKSRNCGLCVVYIQKYGATLLVGAWQREKQQNKLVEWKAFVDNVKSADLKNKFFSRVLRLSVLPWCWERPQTVICCLEWFGRLKCLATRLDAFLSSFSTSGRCSRNRSPSRLPVSSRPVSPPTQHHSFFRKLPPFLTVKRAIHHVHSKICVYMISHEEIVSSWEGNRNRNSSALSFLSKLVQLSSDPRLCLQGDSSNAFPGKCFVQLPQKLFTASSTSSADRYQTFDQT